MGIFEGLIGGITSLFGGSQSAKAAREAAAANERMQKEFAQNGIQWKVEDAKKAGIHPLYALGANTIAASPSYVGDTSFGAGIAQAGQDIGRAIDSTRTAPDRVQARMGALALERGELENQLLRSQIAKLNAAPNPPFPSTVDSYAIAGQPSSGVARVPMEQTASAPGAPNREPDAVNDVGWARTNTGYAPVPSIDVKNRIEDQIIPEVLWSIRNNILPSLGYNRSPPPQLKPKAGERVGFNPFSQEYYIQKERYRIPYTNRAIYW